MTFREFIRTLTMRQQRHERYLYNLRTEGEHYIITKHDEDMEVVSKYHMHRLDKEFGHFSMTCDCPQSHKPTCRHRKMFPMMIDRVDTGWFFDFDDTGQWFDPFGTADVDLASAASSTIESSPATHVSAALSGTILRRPKQ